MSPMDSPRWYRALSLNERLALPGEPLDSDAELGVRRMAEWRQQTELIDTNPFAVYLESLGVDEAGFLALLGETDTSLQQRCAMPPSWLQKLQRYYADEHVMPEPEQVFREQHQEYPLLRVAAPILATLHQRLLDDIRTLTAEADSVPFDPVWLCGRFYEQFLLWMLWVMRRVMILELNISRMEKQFPGETPEQRYQMFIEHYSQSANALQLLEHYPVLARKIVEQVDIFIAAGMQVVQRLLNDYRLFGEAFFGDQPGQLSAVELNLSDPHRNGRRVFKLTFADDRQLIYKPKSQRVDICYQHLIDDINRHPLEGDQKLLPLKTLRILDRGDYGWVECVRPEPCADQAQLERFYQRQGINMAILYLLNANDFHYENLIACGEHPVLVDLETLYQPRVTDESKARIHLDPMNATVLALGLLPYQTGLEGNRKHEVGGLGGARGQSLTVRQLTGYNTDELQFTLQQVESPGADNLPELDGKSADIWAMREPIVTGFTVMYRWLLENRQRLQSDTGPLAGFADAEVRAIFRGTEQYSALASAGWHPDIVQNALFKDRLWSKLWRRGYLNRLYRHIFPYEIQAMERGDVPLFSTRGDSCAVSVNDAKSLPDIFDESGQTVVNERLHSLSLDDMQRQVWLIRSSLDSRRPENLLRTYSIEPLPTLRNQSIRKSLATHEAVKIGNRLADLMVVYLDKPNWFDFKLADTETRINSLQSMQLTLYDGLSGMLLFFEHLARRTGNERFARISDQLLARINHAVDEDASLLAGNGIGGYSGWPGIVYAYVHLAALRGDPGLLDYAGRLVDACGHTLDEPDDFDLIGGASGALVVFCRLYSQTGDQQHLGLIKQLADWLVETAVEQQAGVAWVNAATQENPLTGLAHGAAGPILALIEAATALQQPDYLNTARQGIAYEDAWYSEQRRTWLDLRTDRKTDADEYDAFYAWCHGAPGIGIARLAGARVMENSGLTDEALMESLRKDIRRAAQSTLAEGFGGSHSLCHGDLGNLDAVVSAGDYLGDKDLANQAQQMSLRVLENIHGNGYRCGGVIRRELLGLMLGLAGVGYGLLRLDAPDEIPSVLSLEIC